MKCGNKNTREKTQKIDKLMWFERKQQQQEIMNQMLLASTKCDENFGITFSQCEDSLTQHCTNEEQNKKIALDVIPKRLNE